MRKRKFVSIRIYISVPKVQGSKICFYGIKTLVSAPALNRAEAHVMARPRKPAAERRSEIVRFAVRPAEYDLILSVAKAAHMTVSDYGRAMCLKGEVIVKQTRSLDWDTIAQLRRIGVNLNQAVHKFHATGEAPPDLVSIAKTVEDFMMSQLDDES